MATFVERMIGAAKLDAEIYEEVEADTNAMGQAMGVVLLSSLAAGIGSGGSSIVLVLIASLIAWFIWAFITYLIGTKLLPEPQTRSDIGELLRTIGFSSSPGIIRILGIIPGLTGIVFLAAGIWMLVAMIIAVKHALDYTSIWRAIGVCFIGWIIQVIILGSIYSAFVGPGPQGPA